MIFVTFFLCKILHIILSQASALCETRIFLCFTSTISTIAHGQVTNTAGIGIYSLCVAMCLGRDDASALPNKRYTMGIEGNLSGRVGRYEN